MPKKKTRNKSKPISTIDKYLGQTNRGLFYAKLIGIALLLVIAGIVLVNNAVNNSEAEQEKQELLNQQTQIETIANDIATKFPPDERDGIQSCRYQSDKFEKGDLYCTVNESFIYREINYAEANLIIKDFSKSSRSTIEDVSTYQPVTKLLDSETEKKELRQKLDMGTKCFITYMYETKSEKGTLEVDLFCQEKSKAEHFTVEK